MILPMERVEVVGPRDLLASALRFLQAQGVLEFRAPSPAEGTIAPCAPPAVLAARAARAEEALHRIEALGPRLPAPRGAEGAGALPEPGTPELLDALRTADAEIAAIEARRAALVEEGEALARFTRLVVALAPLRHTLDPALAPEIHAVELRDDPEAVALLASEVRRITGDACEVTAKPLDADRTGVLVVVPRTHGRAVTALLFERGVDEVRLPSAYAGKGVLDLLLLVAARGRVVPRERAEADEALARIADRLSAPLAAAAAAARAEIARLRAAERCGATRFAFVATGYMPRERVAGLCRDAAEALGERVAVFARSPTRAEWSEVPVVLRNPRAVRPFELLLALVPLPRYGSTDPTPWLAAFFPLFFGFVLGDVAFGVLGVGVALGARARGAGGALGRDLAWIGLACSLWAIVFGVLFGEALGELGSHVGIHPVLVDRRGAFMSFLGLALALGGAHVAIGMALGITGALRAGHPREALGRAAKLGLLCTGGALGAILGDLLPGAALKPALAAGGVLLAVAMATEGPMAALELVLGLGNVLSYARLMALGLASVMLAEVANLVAVSLHPVAAGVAIGVLLHAVNFTLGLISPTVAALRLHYVEFFEKFYAEGGAPYRPFALAS
jgi:V/A-type H+-transporting ATPase subunit I